MSKLLLIPAVCLIAGGAMAQPLAHVRATATVSAAVIRLEDVAQANSGTLPAAWKGVEIAPSPLPGHVRVINDNDIRIKLRQQGLDSSMLAAETTPCRVTRAAQQVTTDQLVEAASKFVEDGLGTGEGKVVVEPLTRPMALTLPAGKLSLTAAYLGESGQGNSRQVVVKADVDGEEISHVDLVLRIHRFVQAAVAKTALQRGAPFEAGDVAYEERDATTLPPDALLEGQSTDGLVAVQSIAAGSIVTAKSAMTPALVHRGDSVTLRARLGGIEVTASATAAEDGRLGDSIRVKNLESNLESRATVVDAKTVEAPL